MTSFFTHDMETNFVNDLLAESISLLINRIRALLHAIQLDGDPVCTEYK